MIGIHTRIDTSVYNFAVTLTIPTRVAILFKRGFKFQILQQTAGLEGRYILFQIHIEKEMVTLINIYAPTQNDPREQLQLIDNIEDLLSDFVRNAFYAGDFIIGSPQIFNKLCHVSDHTTYPSFLSDRLFVEYYKVFCEQLHAEFFYSIMHSLQLGQLLHEQQTGLITLVPEKDQGRSDMETDNTSERGLQNLLQSHSHETPILHQGSYTRRPNRVH